MAESTTCFLPKFDSAIHGPNRPVAIKTRGSPVQNVQLLSAWHQGRLSSLLQATWALVLRCYTGSDDICFGYQCVAAECPDLTKISTKRITIRDCDSLREVIDKAKNDSSGSVSGICENTNTESDSGPLFNTTLLLRSYCGLTNEDQADYSQSTLIITLPDECRARLQVKVLREDVGIFLEWWNQDMSTEQMKGVANVFENLLSSILSEEDMAVEMLDYFTEEDWRRICNWNSALPESSDRCIHQIIHEQMLLRPEEQAVCAWDGSLTYGELDRLASALACNLQTQGVGPESKVALCFDKSKWNIVAILGVLKAGGAFVPLDPAHPTARLESLVKTVQAKVMLCSLKYTEYLKPVVDILIPLSDDSLPELSVNESRTGPLTGVTSENAAYVIFTSGSTGEPKGVLVEHKAYCSSAFAHAAPFRIEPGSRVLQFAAHTFDASLPEILTPLMRGSCVCVPSEEARLNDIVKVINDMGVNHMCLTPSFIEFIDPSCVPGVEVIILAGEAMSPSHIASWSNRYLINGYGPTEAAVCSSINPGITKDSQCRDIGFAAGVRSWIVKPGNHDELAPVGCPGELLLEGPTLARGYIKNQQKTDEVFIYDPKWTKARIGGTGRRFYKTGDLVRYSTDTGCLTYIGRKDAQIKLHGQRIELGEIENHLSVNEKVKHCMVQFPNSGFSKGKIVAIVSLSVSVDDRPGLGLTPFKLLDYQTKADFVAEARQRLGTNLPKHMIPSVWLCLETLPLLTSGKLDRKSVASWVGSMEQDPNLQLAKTGSSREGTELKPKDEIESQLVSLWSKILNIPTDHIGLSDSFIGLGGDSIAAITCSSHCKKRGIGLTVQDILHSKSIRELASRAKAVDHSAVYQETVEEPFDLSPIQKIHFWLRKEGQGYFNQSILTHLSTTVDANDLRHAVEILVKRHSMLRARFTDHDGRMRQRITQDVTGSYHWCTHDVKTNEEVKHAISMSQARMNSVSGPVLGVDLFTVGGKELLLSMVAHHLVVDIVSWRIILEDLEDLLLNPRESPTQNSSLPFQTWCRLQADKCQIQEDDEPFTVEDHPGPDFSYWGMEDSPIIYGDAACEKFEIDAESTSLILRGCHKNLRTEPVDIFLACLLHSFAQTFKDRLSPVIHNEGHGREVWDPEIDISRTVGWFTTLYPVHIPDIDLLNPQETVIRVKDIRKRVPDNGRQDFARRILTSEDEKCFQRYPMEISFNYVGQHRDLQREDGLFQLVEQMAGETSKGGGAADFGEETPRFALFEISAVVVQGRLRFNFSFNRFMHLQGAIRVWISRCRNMLTSIGEHLRSLSPRFTLSDFPMLSLTYESLEAIMSERLPSIGIESSAHIEDMYPCSRLQQGVLLSRSRDSSLYAVHGTFEVRGAGNHKPDVDRLQLAWQNVVSHHAMLRTVFVENLTSRDLFCQVVLKDYTSKPVAIQCSDDEDVLQTLDSQPPADYDQHRPGHRFSICQTAAGKLFCRLELNHAAMDGASISIILRDLQLAYSGGLVATRRPLFKDFIRYLLESPRKAALDYWCSYLRDIQPCNFPVLTDNTGSPRELRCLRLNFESYAELRKFSETNGITISTAFNVAWGLTLRSYCGTDDVCFSYMASLRDLPVDEIESVVGPIINLLACRMKVAGDSVVKDVLHQVQNDYMDSFPYRHCSLIDIQHALQMSDKALFNTGVSYQKLPARSESAKGDVQFLPKGSIHDPAEFPVFVNVEVMEDEAQIELNYWTTALTDNQATHLSSTFLHSLNNIIQHQEAEICQLDSLSQRSVEQIRMWNSDIPESIDGYVHELFDYEASIRQNALAVASCDGDITYSELRELSSRLATYLRMLGVGPGVMVPIDFEKSRWMVVTILAVFKVGGGCVPLNSDHSLAYLGKWMAENGTQVALASPNKAKSLEGTIPYVVTVDSSLFKCLYCREGYILSPAITSAAAYVSTTGCSDDLQYVVIDHSTILTRAQNFAKCLQINAETRLFQYAAYTSDIFLQELFGTLIHGGCLFIAPEDTCNQIPALTNNFGANLMSITPSIATYLVPSDIPGVKAVVLNGERMPRKVRDIWGTEIQLHTLYGSAECSSCIHNQHNRDSSDLRKIGSSTGCMSWVVDPSNHNQLLPVGCIGELVIEGPVIAHGYLDDRGQTDSNFIEDPNWISTFKYHAAGDSDKANSVAKEPKRRMFKTGDLVRYDSDGSLVYAGKKSERTTYRSLVDTWRTVDNIETVLPPESRCAVEWVTCYDPNDEKDVEALAVFVFLGTNSSISVDKCPPLIEQISHDFQELTATVHAHLLSHLPSNHLPSLYFPVSDMPLDFHGKLNRQALRQSVYRISRSGQLAFNVKRLIEFRRSNEQKEFNSPAYQYQGNQTSSSLIANTKYWKRYLGDIEPCLFPSLSQVAESGKVCFETLRVNDVTGLYRYSRIAGVPASHIFQLVWGLVLRCYTGLEEACFAYAISDRDVPRDDRSAQLKTSTNALVCKLSLRDNKKIEQVLQAAKAEFDCGMRNHASPAEVQQELGFGDDAPLFNTALSCHEVSKLDESRAWSDNAYFIPTKYKITVDAEICETSAEVCFGYSTNSLSNEQIRDVVDCFKHILDNITVQIQSGSVIGDLDFFTERTCQRVREWNATLPARPKKCAHEVIRKQTKSLPVSAPAICSWDAELTYSELEGMSARLAQALVALGVKPEVFVVLCFEKSAWAVVAQLAVLKAGGAFASLDPSHPEARLKSLVSDLGAHIVLCSEKYHGQASKIGHVALVVDENAIASLPKPSSDIHSIRTSPENAAYAIFTSGTTGKPKATVLEHIALTTAAAGLAKTLNMDHNSRTLQFSSYTFDVSVLETILTLMTGGCICIPSDEERMNDLAGAIRRMKANLISVPPAITNTLEPRSVPSMKTVITGGDKINASHIERWSDRCVINAYGPSESTIVATASVKVDREGRRINNDSNSIGFGLCGRTWVVDPYNHHRLVPVGAVGELVLEGSNVARGYLNNEQKTNEVFIKDPAWTEHDGLRDVLKRKERMYRTGDLVRYNSDGSITFISRKDTQLKVNGIRVEAEGIENQCLQYLPEGAQVAVDMAVPKSKAAAKGLAVFFTVGGIDTQKDVDRKEWATKLLQSLGNDLMETIKQLQKSLAETLPSNLIPKYYFPVRYLPFTTSGKLDRKGLRGMAESLPKEKIRSYIPSSTSINSKQVSENGFEGKLRRLWEQVLDLAPGSVRAEDNFFGLGGDSYSAMRLVGIAQSHGISLTVANIFKSPLFMDMAQSCGVSTKVKGTALPPFRLLSESVEVENILDEAADECCVNRGSIADVYPCSPVQEGLLVLSIKQQGAYIAQPTFRLAKGVDIERFKAAWQETVNQLDILRTRIIHTENEEFLQVVLREAAISWTSAKTLGELPQDTLDLPKHNGGELTGYTIIESDTSPERYFVWTVHHALYDGWTVPLILRRVEEHYYGSVPEAPTVSYGLFIQHLAEVDMPGSDQFWMSYLSNLSSAPFPQNKNPLPNAVRAGNSHSNSLDISMKSTNMDLTLPVLIRAAWAIVVSTHTGSLDVCYGETLAGRNINLPGIMDITGPTLTTVPTRIQIDNNQTISEYLKGVHQSAAEMIPHQHSGLQRIRKLSNDTAAACEFQNLLVIQSDEGQLKAGIWTAEGNRTSGEFFTHPLVLECKIYESEVLTTIHHDELVVDSWLAQKLIGQFSFVLSQLLDIPKGDAKKVGQLDLFSPQDKEQVSRWNSQQPVVVDKCIHDIVLEKGLAQPEAMAACGWDGQLSYLDLCETSVSFARYLRSRGIGSGDIVPVCLDKSIWVAVTILSILMTGGAFLPLDPAHPTSRHEEILTEVDANILLCSPHYCSRYSKSVKTVIPISKETIQAYGALKNSAEAPNNVSGSRMAYALFTSGSTGRPKGIVIEHRAVVSSVMAFGPIVKLNSDSRVLQFASLTFDAAILEVLGTLLFGGCICFPSEDERLNDVAGAIRRMNASWTFLTPSIAGIIEPSAVPSLKTIACGGEAVPREIMTKWMHKVELLIAYGPTETTIFAVINADLPANREPACIGRGIPCTATWVVDPENHDRLTPLGAVGELALEGPALAREYLKNPEKTAEAFVDEPAWAAGFPTSIFFRRRIYKTGDLVRYNTDGTLVYLGRKDNQVKLHGQRFELLEVEFRLKEDSRVHNAIVALPKAGRLQKRLVAILSLKSLSSGDDIASGGVCELISENDMMNFAYPELVEIQKNLEAQLPTYMVPQTWAVIKKFPMLVSGKLDRKAITNWIENVDDSLYDRIMQDYDVIKRSKVEGVVVKPDDGAVVNVLQDIIAQVLNIPSHRVSLDRSFVGLGGDSITGMAVISRARKQGLKLALHDILQSGSVRELAETAGSSVPIFRQEEKTGEHFRLSPIQDLYFRSADVQPSTGYFNQSIMVRVTRRVEPVVIENAVKAIVKQHSMFRARFSKASTGEWRQSITDEIDSSYRLRLHSINNEDEITSAVAQSQRCLDIRHGPILAADLFEIRGANQVLYLVANHLCVDMVSWRIVLQDIQEYIDSGSLAPEKPLSFKNWCELQLNHSKNDMKGYQLPFAVESPNLRYWGMEHSPNVYGDIKIEGFTLDDHITGLILGKCHEVLRTDTIDMLLSAVLHSFHRVFTDRKIPTLYNEGHGRETWDSSIDLSRTVGWFTTLCPLGVEVNSNDILSTIKRVKDTRRKFSDNGRSWFAHSLLHKRQSSSTDFAVPLEIVFNYLGRLQQLERGDSLFQHYGEIFNDKDFEAAGDMGRETPRFALLEISAIVVQEKLHISFAYNRNMSRETQICRWISECKNILEKDIPQLKDAAHELTLSDYPLLPITYGGLESLARDIFPKVGVKNKDQVEDIYPCSPMQEGILFSQLRDPNAYIFHTVFEVRDSETGRTDLERLRRAWQMVVNRHPILRTVFVESNYPGGTFDQLVLTNLNDNIHEFECDDSEVLETLEANKLRELNDERVPKISHQLTICTTFTGRVVFMLEMNHAIIDGGSIGILLRDFALAYGHQLPNGRGPLYSDYIKYIKTSPQDQALAHWTHYMKGVRPCHLSFTNETKSGRQLKAAKMKFDRFPELQRFCEEHSVTLANLTLSAWAIVLHHFTGSDDVCFGYPSAGRDAPVPGIQDAVGIFINMLCCRVKFADGQTLTDISKMVQDHYISSLPYQSCSLASIQHELGLQGQSLFNTTLSIQNHSEVGDPMSSPLSFILQKAYDPSEYPVTVNVETARDREGIVLRYWTDSMSESQAKCLAAAIAQVFTCFIERPSEHISELDIDFDTVPGTVRRTRKVSWSISRSVRSITESVDTNSIQRLIDDRVHEVISQMLKNGQLAIPTASNSNGAADNKSEGDQKFTSSRDIAKEKEKLAEIEKKLWSLWSLALALPPSSVRSRDSFFKLGGDSIAAMKMVSIAREQGLALSVADVFSNPVFEDMVAVVGAAVTSHTQEEPQVQKECEQPTQNKVIPEESISSRNSSVIGFGTLDDMSLQSRICPQVGVFKGGIADVLPTTDFQALSITASLFKSRWMLNYFYLDGKGPLDLKRLREACMRVVESFDILRTVFVCVHGQFFQVVLRKLRPGIFVHETEDSLDEFTESLQRRDREREMRQGEQYVQFFIVKKKGAEQHHRILIRMSHTQFDGVCLSKIMSALKMAYEGSPLPPGSSFAHYMRLLPGTITPEHYQHWTTLLKGSKMPALIRREEPNTFQHIGSFTELKKTIDISPNALGNVTIATLMQSAWALTLAKLCSQSDIVFGLTINGRNTTVPGVENTVGPCVNVIPVRVKFGEKWTALDLFRYLQDQQVANMPYESLGFREIIRHCTDWPDWTSFSTSVFHQNVDYEGQMQLDTTQYRLGGAGVLDSFSDLTLYSKQKSPDKLDISLGYSAQGPIHPSFAGRALDMVSETIYRLISNPNAILPSPSTLRSLPSQAIPDHPRSSEEHFLSSHLKNRSIAELLVHSDILTKCWQQVLPHPAQANYHQTTFQLDSSFFDLGGDIISVAQLVWLLEQEGLHVRIEDLLKHPSFLGHMAVLALYNDPTIEKDVDGAAAGASAQADSHNLVGPGQEPVDPKPENKRRTWGKAVTLARKITKRKSFVLNWS